MARRTFEFVIKTYNYNDIKYEAMLWVAHANIQIGDFNRAEPMLDMLLSKITKGEAPEKHESDESVTGNYSKFQKRIPWKVYDFKHKPDRLLARCNSYSARQ